MGQGVLDETPLLGSSENPLRKPRGQVELAFT